VLVGTILGASLQAADILSCRKQVSSPHQEKTTRREGVTRFTNRTQCAAENRMPRKVERERPNLPNKWACATSTGLDSRVLRPLSIVIACYDLWARGRLRDASVLPLLRDGGCGLISTSSQEYRSRADDCERLAANATNSEVRRTLLYLAKRWRGFAAEADSGQRRSSDGSFPQHPSK
jgi:hypothetical protein